MAKVACGALCICQSIFYHLITVASVFILRIQGLFIQVMDSLTVGKDNSQYQHSPVTPVGKLRLKLLVTSFLMAAFERKFLREVFRKMTNISI